MAMNPETNKMETVFAARDAHADSLLTELERTKGQLYRADGTPVPDHWSIFSIDEEVVIKSYIFRVAYLGDNTLLFEPVRPLPDPLPKDET